MMFSMFIVKCIFVLSLKISFIVSQGKMSGTYRKQQTKNNFLITEPGHELTIKCPYTNDFEWSYHDFENKRVIKTFNTSKYISTDDTITIKKTELIDSGLYYCTKNNVNTVFTVLFYLMTKSSNGSAPINVVKEEINNIKFEETKLDEKKGISVSCTCTTGSVKSAWEINWKGGHYQKLSSKYKIDKVKNGSSLTETLTLIKAENNPELYGKYACMCDVISQSYLMKEVYMKSSPIFKETKSSFRTSEGNKITLECNVWSYPPIDPKSVYWMFQNDTISSDFTIKTNVTSGLVYSTLTIPKTAQNHRGLYTCHASNELGSNVRGFMVRVKGKYAAVWPLIGIIIQLIILIGIITVYELKKKREQSNNSNPDQSASKLAMTDSVNASDRPGEGSDVRQRLVKT